MVVADGLVPIWRQDICNHRDDLISQRISGMPNVLSLISSLMVNTLRHRRNIHGMRFHIHVSRSMLKIPFSINGEMLNSKKMLLLTSLPHLMHKIIKMFWTCFVNITKIPTWHLHNRRAENKYHKNYDYHEKNNADWWERTKSKKKHTSGDFPPTRF